MTTRTCILVRIICTRISSMHVVGKNLHETLFSMNNHKEGLNHELMGSPKLMPFFLHPSMV